MKNFQHLRTLGFTGARLYAHPRVGSGSDQANELIFKGYDPKSRRFQALEHHFHASEMLL